MQGTVYPTNISIIDYVNIFMNVETNKFCQKFSFLCCCNCCCYGCLITHRHKHCSVACYYFMDSSSRFEEKKVIILLGYFNVNKKLYVKF